MWPLFRLKFDGSTATAARSRENRLRQAIRSPQAVGERALQMQMARDFSLFGEGREGQDNRSARRARARAGDTSVLGADRLRSAGAGSFGTRFGLSAERGERLSMLRFRRQLGDLSLDF